MTCCTAPESTLNLEQLNQQFMSASPQEILAWCLQHIPEGLIQSTAFGANGMVIIDMLYRQLRFAQPQPPVPVLFIDTLHHFAETLDLAAKTEALYGLNLKVYKALGIDSRTEFAQHHGKLWETDIEKFYQLTKIEPLERGLQELGTRAWITGRRRDGARTRTQIDIFEWDKNQRLKINPLANWSRKEVWAYIVQNNILYNPLYDQGYASIGEEPLTTPVKPNEDERAGRWRGMDKTECGIHQV